MILPLTEDQRLVANTPSHAEALFNAIDKNRPHLSRFLPWVPNMQSVQQVANYLANCERQTQEGLDYSFNIFENELIIGRIGLSFINQANQLANIGYWLCESVQGKGVITRAARQMIQLGFETLGLNRLEIKAAVENKRSRAVPEKLGFAFEGILRQAELVNNTYHDLALYSLLRSEWQPPV